MLGQSLKVLMLMLVCGLCAPAMANTTENAAAQAVAAEPVRVALMLPLRSDALGAAAQAVRAGFMAAWERESDGVEVRVIETADGAANVLSAFDAAQAGSDIIVGPLSRTDVGILAVSGKVAKPTLVLAPPDAVEGSGAAASPPILAIGLSVEDEARQLASWAGEGRTHTRAYVIAGPAAWQRRVARAFTAQWEQQGREAQQVEVFHEGGYVAAAALAELKRQLNDDKRPLLFLALDAAQARQLQQALGPGQTAYGTSQLNPWGHADWHAAEAVPEMNGVRLLDMPWMLQPDHPAAMIYPRLVTAPDQRASADLERLYALGIDAFRVAREIAARRTDFSLDGVTGRLRVRFGSAGNHFHRAAQPAAYRDGKVEPLSRRP